MVRLLLRVCWRSSPWLRPFSWVVLLALILVVCLLSWLVTWATWLAIRSCLCLLSLAVVCRLLHFCLSRLSALLRCACVDVLFGDRLSELSGVGPWTAEGE